MDLRFKIVFGLIALTAAVIAWGVYRSYLIRGPVDPAWFEEPQELTVVAYPSFVSSFGPGPQIVAAFRERCQCEVKLVNGGDTGVLLQRLLLRPDRMGADVVLGLDQFALAEARESMDWLPLGQGEWIKWRDPLGDRIEEEFWPYNWAPMTLLFKKSEQDLSGVQTWDQLLGSLEPQSLALQDPRTSHPGSQMVYWFWSWARQKALAEGPNSSLEEIFVQELSRLQPLVHSLSPSWSKAYGLFKRGQAAVTFSYLTSPVFHRVVEEDWDIEPMIFSQPHPYQIEYMGIPQSCQQCDRAKEFVLFMLEPEVQAIIMEKNFMLPVIESVEEGTAFAEISAKLSSLPLLSREIEAEFLELKESLERQWVEALRRR